MSRSNEQSAGLIEWAVICRVPSEESAYLYYYLELFEGIFNFSTRSSSEGSTNRELIAITNESLLNEAKDLFKDIQEKLNLTIIEDFHPVHKNDKLL